MDRARNQFLAGAGFAEEQDGDVGRRRANDQLQHPLERRRAANQPVRGDPAARVAHGLERFDEVTDAPVAIPDRRRLDIDMLLAARGVVEVQHALRRTGGLAVSEGTGFAGLIAGHLDAV